MLKNNPLSRNQDLVIQELKKELLIYDLRINKAFCLNETSALVWKACDGSRSVAEISTIIRKQTNKAFEEDLVWLAVDQFKQDNLLDNSDQFIPDFNGLSRRQAIKKAGLASVIALPVIASLLAPTAAMAQSAGTCAGTISDIPCGASTNTGFSGDCNACLASLPSCCPGQIVAAPACTAGAVGCTSCTRTCA